MNRYQRQLLLLSVVAVGTITTSVFVIDAFAIARVFMILGILFALVALRLALKGDTGEDAGGYKQIVVQDAPDRIPATPLSVNRLPAPPSDAPAATDPPRTKSPTDPPPRAKPTSDPPRTKAPTAPPPRTNAPSEPPSRPRPGSDPGRAKAPSAPPRDVSSRARTSSSGPIDVSARLVGAPIDVAMRAPVPAPEPIPEDQIPVAPESGLTIRKRTPSAGPIAPELIPIVPEVGLAIRNKPPAVGPAEMPSLSARRHSGPPADLRGRIRYATTTMAFSNAGITASREDGLDKRVKWRDVVGVVARRMPPQAPYGGLTFVDIVSTAGATLRVLPWTEVIGHPIEDDPITRARTLVRLIDAQSPDARLDAATKTFAGGGRAAQLPDETMLAAHDARLA